jgi:K+-sensing histidine kinase KdpD
MPALLQPTIIRARRPRGGVVGDLLRRLARAAVRALRRERHQLLASGHSADDCRTRVEDDLKSPVTSIRAAAEILRDHEDVPVDERARFLAAIIEDSRRIERFADGLLARIEPASVRRHPADLNRQAA